MFEDLFEILWGVFELFIFIIYFITCYHTLSTPEWTIPLYLPIRLYHRADPGLHIAARNAKHRGKNSWLWVIWDFTKNEYSIHLHTLSWPKKTNAWGINIPFLGVFYHFCQFLPTNMDGFLETQMGWRFVRFHWGVEQKRDYKTKHMGM